MELKKIQNISILLLISFILVFFMNMYARAVQMGGPGSYNTNMFNDNVNGGSRVVIKNLSDGIFATAQLNLRNDVDQSLSLGIGGSNLSVPGTEGPGSGAMVLESEANLTFNLLYDEKMIWKINESDDGGIAGLANQIELDSSRFKVLKELQANDYYSGAGSQGLTLCQEITVVGGGLQTFCWEDGLLTSKT
jgi:hypothetical protein